MFPSFLDMLLYYPILLFCLETCMKTCFYMFLHILFYAEIVVAVLTSSDGVFCCVLDIVSVDDLKGVFVVVLEVRKTRLDKFEQVLTTLNKFRQIWTSLNKLTINTRMPD